LKLVDNNAIIEHVAVAFENGVRFVTRVVKFLEDVGWIKQDSNSSFQMIDEIISSKINGSKLVI
jgi:hypothetical protein